MATFDMEKDAKDTIDVLESYDAKRKRDAEKTWTVTWPPITPPH